MSEEYNNINNPFGNVENIDKRQDDAFVQPSVQTESTPTQQPATAETDAESEVAFAEDTEPVQSAPLQEDSEETSPQQETATADESSEQPQTSHNPFASCVYPQNNGEYPVNTDYEYIQHPQSYPVHPQYVQTNFQPSQNTQQAQSPYGEQASHTFYARPLYQEGPLPYAPQQNTNNLGNFQPQTQHNPYGDFKNQNVPNSGEGTPVSPKKKTPVGLIVFLISAFVLLVLCICLTVYAVSTAPKSDIKDAFGDFYSEYAAPYGGFDGNEDNDSDSLEIASDALDEDDLVDTTNKNFGGLELQNQPSDIFEDEKYTAKYAYDKARESVVGIIGYTDTAKETIGSQGTGIVVSSDGYIITNSHVIGDSKTLYKVVVSIDGSEYDAQVTGFDTRTDLAVLKIEKTDLTPASFADSDQVEVGQEVIAIGNPGGIEFSNSLTQGIVSALDRDVSHGTVGYIQTDTAINPGNSGGPLLNMNGQVIGITTVKIVSTSYEGMGFAIPSQQAVEIIDSIIKDGFVEGRVKIGLTGMEFDAETASYYDAPTGIYVSSVDENGPIANSQVEEGDILTKIDDVEITSFSVLYKELDNHKAGDKVTLTFSGYDEYSRDYEEFTVECELAEVVNE